jgi:hypothetical protein
MERYGNVYATKIIVAVFPLEECLLLTLILNFFSLALVSPLTNSSPVFKAKSLTNIARAVSITITTTLIRLLQTLRLLSEVVQSKVTTGGRATPMMVSSGTHAVKEVQTSPRDLNVAQDQHFNDNASGKGIESEPVGHQLLPEQHQHYQQQRLQPEHQQQEQQQHYQQQKLERHEQQYQQQQLKQYQQQKQQQEHHPENNQKQSDQQQKHLQSQHHPEQGHQHYRQQQQQQQYSQQSPSIENDSSPNHLNPRDNYHHNEGQHELIRPVTAASYSSLNDIWNKIDGLGESWERDPTPLPKPGTANEVKFVLEPLSIQ